MDQSFNYLLLIIINPLRETWHSIACWCYTYAIGMNKKSVTFPITLWEFQDILFAVKPFTCQNFNWRHFFLSFLPTKWNKNLDFQFFFSFFFFNVLNNNVYWSPLTIQHFQHYDLTCCLKEIETLSEPGGKTNGYFMHFFFFLQLESFYKIWAFIIFSKAQHNAR